MISGVARHLLQPVFVYHPLATYAGCYLSFVSSPAFSGDTDTLNRQEVEDNMPKCLAMWIRRNNIGDYKFLGAKWLPTTLDVYANLPGSYRSTDGTIVRNAIAAIINQQHQVQYVIADIIIEHSDDGAKTSVSYCFSLLPDTMSMLANVTIEVPSPIIIVTEPLPASTEPEPASTTTIPPVTTTTPRNYYVYTLRYPDGTPFYVGKGSGDRLHQHVRSYRREDDGSIKHRVTGDILQAGLEVDEHIEVEDL